jgi:endonuclease-3
MEHKKKRAEKILKMLKKVVPHAGMILKYKNNWELLVAVILSAQCTDKKVNEVTEKLFRKYKKLDDYIHAKPKEFEKDIWQTGFYKNKTKNILAAAKYIKSEHGGKIPKTMEEMIKIPGVGRKTANVVLGNAYGVVEGIAVDTHVFRLAHVLKLSDGKTPELVEKDLINLFPKKEWFKFTYYLIEYGRKYCTARKHNHKNCLLSKI